MKIIKVLFAFFNKDIFNAMYDNTRLLILINLEQDLCYNPIPDVFPLLFSDLLTGHSTKIDKAKMECAKIIREICCEILCSRKFP